MQVTIEVTDSLLALISERRRYYDQVNIHDFSFDQKRYRDVHFDIASELALSVEMMLENQHA